MKKNEEETQELGVDAYLSVNGEEEIAKRAYALWQQRNYEYGNDLADWFEAERELKGRD
jgi:hypothetical protein